MIKFKDFMNENIENIEDLIPELKEFVEELSGYVLYNDDESRDNLLMFLRKYKKELQKLKVIKKFKKLYRVVSLKDEKSYKHRDLTSTTKKKYTGEYLEDVKDMIGQYTNTKDKDFYWAEIDNAEGFDFNVFGKLFQGKKKYYTGKYDSSGDMTFDVFYDTIKDLKKQNEVILFEKYNISNLEKIE